MQQLPSHYIAVIIIIVVSVSSSTTLHYTCFRAFNYYVRDTSWSVPGEQLH